MLSRYDDMLIYFGRIPMLSRYDKMLTYFESFHIPFCIYLL